MGGQGRAGNRSRLCVLALLLVLALGMGSADLAGTLHISKHGSRVAAALAGASVDLHHAGLDSEVGGGPPASHIGAAEAATRDSSSSVSSGTAQSPPVRGPPGHRFA